MKRKRLSKMEWNRSEIENCNKRNEWNGMILAEKIKKNKKFKNKKGTKRNEKEIKKVTLS